MVTVSQREFDRLKQIVKEGETNRIKSRNRVIAAFTTIFVFMVAAVLVYFL